MTSGDLPRVAADVESEDGLPAEERPAEAVPAVGAEATAAAIAGAGSALNTNRPRDSS